VALQVKEALPRDLAELLDLDRPERGPARF